MKRRSFVLNTSLLSLASLVQIRCKNSEMAERKDIGLQLYTVRSQMEEDPVGTLEAISLIGYSHIESIGYNQGKYYGMAPKVFHNLLNDLGLNMFSGHTQTGSDQPQKTHTMTNQWERVCEDAAHVGQKYIVLGYLVQQERKTLDDYKKIAELCNKCGETAREFGLTFAYHNHDFEFNKLEGKRPYDILLSEVDPELMDFEIDLFWTRKAGIDTFDYFNKYPRRFPLWHIKDMDSSSEQNFTEVGNGIIDWSEYFKKAKSANLQYFYIEQDQCINYPPLESVKISFDYLNKLTLNNE
jgi:sugar phosphate isomerase/epimerase